MTSSAVAGELPPPGPTCCRTAMAQGTSSATMVLVTSRPGIRSGSIAGGHREGGWRQRGMVVTSVASMAAQVGDCRVAEKMREVEGKGNLVVF